MRLAQADAALISWACLRVTGADAETFLQGQLSGDVRTTQPRWTSYNSPKGRMLAVLHLVREGQNFDLHVPAALLEPMAKRLRMFVLRAKVTIESLAPRDADEQAAMRERRDLIEAGVPVVYPKTQDRWVAQMANLDLIGGISFDKGCYTGQEVVARLHYLGNLKKRMFRVRGRGAAPAPGTAIRNGAGDAQSVGDIVDAVPDGDDRFVASAVLQVALATSEGLVLDRETDVALAQPEAYTYG
ncbi:MAG: YgfZ/GcvT domain-containing protein [Panacagrimonas sp.]